MKSLPKNDAHASDRGDVIREESGPVTRLVLCRPRYLNAITWTMYERMSAHLDAIREDANVRVVVLTGAGGRALAAGTDIHQFEYFDGPRGVEYEKQIDDVVGRLAELPKPTIAAVEGYAVGGGMALAAACDLRYGNEKAQVGVPIARSLGNCLGLSTYRRLAAIMGVAKVKELIYRGQLLTASECLSSGFFTDVFPDTSFQKQIQSIAEEITRNAPLTIWATKTAFIRQEVWMRENIDHAIDFSDVIGCVYGSNDFQQAVLGRINKVIPRWTGH